MDYQLDLTAFRCPVPLLMLKKAVAELRVSDRLIVLFNSQSAVENFTVFCEQQHCRLLSQKWVSEHQFQAIFAK